jgi:hypothetical protein
LQRERPATKAYTTAPEMENDNFKHYMTLFCGWAANQGIPTYFNEDLSLSSNSKKCCTASTLIAGYIGKHVREIHELLPAHPDWKAFPKDQHPQ